MTTTGLKQSMESLIMNDVREQTRSLKDIRDILLKRPTIIKSIPYQLCPKCNGEGVSPQINQGTSATYANTCNVCNGMKIIPQYPLP